MKPLLAILLAACISEPQREHVELERTTYQWVAPTLRTYLANDPWISEAQKATALLNLDRWHMSILDQERALGIKPPLPKPPIVLQPKNP